MLAGWIPRLLSFPPVLLGLSNLIGDGDRSADSLASLRRNGEGVLASSDRRQSSAARGLAPGGAFQGSAGAAPPAPLAPAPRRALKASGVSDWHANPSAWKPARVFGLSQRPEKGVDH